MKPLSRATLLPLGTVFAVATLVFGGAFVAMPTISQWIRSPRVQPEDDITGLLRTRAFLKAVLDASGSSHPVLAVNLEEGTATLSIQGVPLRAMKVRNATIGSQAMAGDPTVALGGPLLARRATIALEPVRHVLAPTDSLAAAQLAAERIPEEPQPYSTLQTETVTLRLSPSTADAASRLRGIAFRASERAHDNYTIVKAAVVQRAQPLPVELKLTLDPADIRAIFRALAEGSAIVVHPGPPGEADGFATQSSGASAARR